MKKIVILCAFVSLLLANNTKDGVLALKNGDYESAIANFTYAANSGDKIAQQNLGVMYHGGIGVAQDREKATYWFNKSDEEGVHSSNCGCSR